MLIFASLFESGLVSICFQEANGGGEGGREAGGESVDAVSPSRGARQGGVPDDGGQPSSGNHGSQSRQAATTHGPRPSRGSMGLTVRPAATSRRTDLLNIDNETPNCPKWKSLLTLSTTWNRSSSEQPCFALNERESMPN